MIGARFFLPGKQSTGKQHILIIILAEIYIEVVKYVISVCMGAFVKPFPNPPIGVLAAEVCVDWAQLTRLSSQTRKENLSDILLKHWSWNPVIANFSNPFEQTYFIRSQDAYANHVMGTIVAS